MRIRREQLKESLAGGNCPDEVKMRAEIKVWKEMLDLPNGILAMVKDFGRDEEIEDISYEDIY